MTMTTTDTRTALDGEELTLAVDAFIASMEGVVPPGALGLVLNALTAVPAEVVAELLVVFDLDPTDKTRERYEAALAALMGRCP